MVSADGIESALKQQRKNLVEHSWQSRGDLERGSPPSQRTTVKHQDVHGLNTGTLVADTSVELRVTKVRLCSKAVAASKPSITGIGVAASPIITPQRSATFSSSERIRPTKRCLRSRLSHASSFTRRAASGWDVIPLRISPSVRTLRYKSPSSVSWIHCTTFGSGFLRRSSDTTLVSRRNPLTVQYPFRSLIFDQSRDLLRPMAISQRTQRDSPADERESASQTLPPVR